MTESVRDPMSEEPQTEYAWRDAQWLVLHERKAVLPRRCMVCNAPADDRPVRMSIGKPISPLGFIFFGWFALAVHQGCSARVWLCPTHRAKERGYQWVLRALVATGILFLVCGILSILFFPEKSGLVFLLCSVLPIMLSPFVFFVAAIFAIVRPRLVDTLKVDKPFVWLDNVHPDYLARFPEVPAEG